MTRRAFVLALAAVSACSSGEKTPSPNEDKALGGDIAARVGVQSIPLALVADVARARKLSAHEAAQKVIDDGHLPDGIPVWAVDANASFARPGPRLVDGVEALAGIFHPGVAQPPHPAMARRLR